MLKHWLSCLAGTAFSAATLASVANPGTLDELQRAESELASAALLRNVATDTAEVEHLAAARDLLRAADGGLPQALRIQARRLEFDIDSEIGDAAEMVKPRRDASIDAPRPWPLIDRGALGALAQQAQTLVRQAQADDRGGTTAPSGKRPANVRTAAAGTP